MAHICTWRGYLQKATQEIAHSVASFQGKKLGIHREKRKGG